MIKKLLLYIFLVLYIALLAKLILFKDISPFELFDSGRTLFRSINLIPLKLTLQYFTNPYSTPGLAFWNIAGNVLLFIPLGVYLKMFRMNRKIVEYIIIIGSISLSFEVLQYIFAVGHSDIDDIIFNTIGGMLGVFVYKKFRSVFSSDDKAKTAVLVLWSIVGIICLAVLSVVRIRL